MVRLRIVAGSFVLLLAYSVSLFAEVPYTRHFGPIIDRYQAFDPQRTCSPTEKPGAIDFRHIVLGTYTRTRNLGIIRACSVGGTSEHKEGRAWDWGVRVTVPAERRNADDLIGWLLQRDPHGNANARLRRFGLMYMIWNRRIWASYRAGEGWRSYSGPNPHTDHVHFSFGWPGARRQTTWWHPERTGTPVLGPGTEEWVADESAEDVEIEGPFPGTTSPDRGRNGVEEAALRLAIEQQLVPIRDGEIDDTTRYCPPNSLVVSWDMDVEAFKHGGNIAPMGPEPDENTNEVTGIVYCKGFDYAYVGFEAWWDEDNGVWMVLNTPTCD
ncbi:MAG: hypothetical protein HYR55_19800 [Acidobacteria bacterium]|nr:hypothetical protein [Acidobacteriota bacterium]MBI3658429.1 hypothetical protein [Acidobacteriota bacterium]